MASHTSWVAVVTFAGRNMRWAQVALLGMNSRMWQPIWWSGQGVKHSNSCDTVGYNSEGLHKTIRVNRRQRQDLEMKTLQLKSSVVLVNYNYNW